jgi:hypothetical protein
MPDKPLSDMNFVERSIKLLMELSSAYMSFSSMSLKEL